MGSGEGTRASRPRMRTLGLLLAGLVAGLLIALATAQIFTHTATTAFCASSCHEMSYPYEEYRASAHYAGRSGVHAECVDCHLPPRYPGKFTLKASRTVIDIWQHIVAPMDTPAKYEARRGAMADRERARLKEGDSAECRACHVTMNLPKQSAAAQAAHAALAQGGSCIDCHAGVGHVRRAADRASGR